MTIAKTPLKEGSKSELLRLRSENELLNSENELLNSENELLNSENELLNSENELLKEQLAWFKRQIFGPRSEKTITANSQQLYFEGFCEKIESPESETKEIPSHTRKKPRRDGQDQITIPEDLPIETHIIDLPEEEKVCKTTGELLVKIGEEVTCKLAQSPASFFVKKIVRPKYALPSQEESGILTAPLPSSIIPKCRADESLLAEVVTKKFADHIPLYRVSEMLRREGVGISRKLLSQWVVRLGKQLGPLYNLMLEKILESKNVFIDETPVTSLEGKKSSKGYMWTLVGGEGADPAYRIYIFKENRRHEHVNEWLSDYDGVLHSDKYGAYVSLAEKKKMTWCPCWVHIRRKFFEAETGDPPFRDWILSKIKQLFEIEERAWLISEEDRLRLRQEESIPIVDELIEGVKLRLVEGKILPKSKFKEALGYFSSLIPYLKNWAYHPNARLDNNVAERAIRPLAIGRKNWLFFGSQNGGEAAATLLSLVQTCRGLGINPREYLEDLFRRFMDHNYSQLVELLPDQWLKNRQAEPPIP